MVGPVDAAFHSAEVDVEVSVRGVGAGAGHDFADDVGGGRVSGADDATIVEIGDARMQEKSSQPGIRRVVIFVLCNFGRKRPLRPRNWEACACRLPMGGGREDSGRLGEC